MARDRAACVARQATVLRHGAGRAGPARGALGRRQQARAGGKRQARARTGSGTAWERRGAVGARRGHGRRAAGARQARGGGTTGAQPGSAGWPRDVHSVHSACFWPDLTQYCF